MTICDDAAMHSAANADLVLALCNRYKFTLALSLYRKLVCEFKITEINVLAAIGGAEPC